MQEYKIIFAGSMGAGKTAAISALSDIDVVSTDVINTDTGNHSKLLTTVGIDYGQIIIPPDTKVSLYGTPGQKRFKFVWSVVSDGALGVIILIDASAANALEDFQVYIDYYVTQGISNIVIGLTHTDLLPDFELTEYYDIMETNNYLHPIFTVDGRRKDDTLLLLETLLVTIESTLVS